MSSGRACGDVDGGGCGSRSEDVDRGGEHEDGVTETETETRGGSSTSAAAHSPPTTTSTSSSSASPSMMEKIVEIKAQLVSAVDQANNEQIMGVLQELDKMEISLTVLRDTMIGVPVGKLRKYKDNQVALLSQKIVSKWKSALPPSPPPTVPPAKSPSPTPSSTTPRKAAPKSNHKTTTASTTATKSPAKVASPKPSPARQATPPTPEKTENRKRMPESNETVSHETTKKPRTVEGEPPPTDTRGKVRWAFKELFANSMAHTDTLDPGEVANQIEQEIFSLYRSTDKNYVVKVRLLRSNLGHKEHELRDSVMSGLTTPGRLVTMTYEELAPDSVKKERQQSREFHTKDIQSAKPEDLAESDQYECKRCHKRMVKLYQMQTRSADEPMTTFVTCVNCGNRWRF